MTLSSSLTMYKVCLCAFFKSLGFLIHKINTVIAGTKSGGWLTPVPDIYFTS